MAEGCGPNCAKWTLFVFNFIFWLTGAALLGVGIYMRVDPSIVNVLKIATVTKSDSLVPGAAIVLICVGLFIFITGFLGCCGAVKENGCMLLTYASILIVILVLQVVAGILAAVFRNQIDTMLTNSMKEVVKDRYGQTNEDSITTAWNQVQEQFKCCGYENGTADWAGSKWYTSQNATNKQTVPKSCCVRSGNGYLDAQKCEEDAKKGTDPSQYVFTENCHDQLLSWIKSKAGILIGVAFGLVFIQVAVIAMACVLWRSKKEYNYV